MREMRKMWMSLVVGLAAVGCAGTQTLPTAHSESALQKYTSGANAFDTHSYFYDTGAEVIVFDAQFTEAEAKKLLTAIRATTQNPIRYVVLTHPNPDKFNGAALFQREGAKVVASESTAAAIPGVHAYKKYFWTQIAKAFTEETYPAEASVDLTFSGTFALPLEGGVRVELTELKNAGVTTTQTVAFLPSQNALIVGDLVHHKAHAWLEGGIRDGKTVVNITAWNAALAELEAWPGAIVFGGRGEAAPVEEVVPAQQRYLQELVALVKAYGAELGARKTELCGASAAPHHVELQKRAAGAFPEYALDYMVGYGVYGLVNALFCEE